MYRVKEITHRPGGFREQKQRVMKANIIKKGLDANFNEVSVVVKYDSMGVNQGTFYVDAEGEHEMTDRMADVLFEENACIR